jgi:hypothetical protein
MSAEEFMNEMTMREIIVGKSGKFECWFDGGNTFGGHSIVVFGHVEKGIRNAEMS